MDDLRPNTNEKRAMLVSARRARRMRNGTIAVLALVGVAAAAFSGPSVPVVWADDDLSGFDLPGRQLMAERMEPVREMAPGLSAKALRALSEARLRAQFEAEREGLWDAECGEGKGEDYTECLAEGGSEELPAAPGTIVPDVIKTAAAAVPIVHGSSAAERGFQHMRAEKSAPARRSHGQTWTGGGGVPIGPLGGTIVERSMPLEKDEPGGSRIPDEPGETPSPNEPAEDHREPPSGEVPIPAPFLLFPAGIVVMRLMRGR